MRLSYGDPYTGKMASLYFDGPQIPCDMLLHDGIMWNNYSLIESKNVVNYMGQSLCS